MDFSEAIHYIFLMFACGLLAGSVLASAVWLFLTLNNR